MTTSYGALVGAVILAANSVPLVSAAYRGGRDQVLIRDRFEGDLAQNDLLSLGKIAADAIINPINSIIWFDDLGTSVTMDIGDATDEDALVAAQDVAAAAGSCSILKSVDIANYWKPLWEQLGMASNPGGEIELFAKFEAANPATGSISWQIIGQPKN